MEVAYWQVLVFCTVAGTTWLFGASVGLWVAIGWTIWSALKIHAFPLMVLQLGTAWVTYWLFWRSGGRETVISEQNKKISRLERALGQALSDYSSETRSLATEAAKHSHHEIIRDKQHKAELLKAIQEANSSLVIVSGWIRSHVVDHQLLSLLEQALRRGVDVFVGYGWQRSDGTHDSDRSVVNARKALDNLSAIADGKPQWGSLLISKNPTHAKVLIKDEDYVICGSNNWLSNKNFKNQEQSIKIWDAELAKQMAAGFHEPTKSHR